MKNTLRFYIVGICLFVNFSFGLLAQPAPCGENPAMTSTCASACVICDIDGFTGVNDLSIPGQMVPGFCTTFQHNMQFIAFIAGTEDLTIRVEVGDCVGGSESLELGFFESLDCETFTPITMCDTDIDQFTNQTFTNNTPLVIGQHYYMIIDGSDSSNCEWTFYVDEGSTAVLPLTTSGNITHAPEVCPEIPVNFETSGDVGAAIFYWSVDGILQGEISKDIDLSFANEGEFEVCVIAANVCDQAPPSCTTIHVREIGSLAINQKLCEGDCVEFNNVQFCTGGSFEEVVTIVNGCDSIISIELEFVPEQEVNLDVWICEGQTFSVGNSNYTQTGMYTDLLLTEDQCDSTVNLSLLTIECEILALANEIPVVCNGSATGTLIFSIDQGQPPFDYTYTDIADGSITGMGTTNLLANNVISNISAGIYQIYVMDDFGNDAVVLQEVTEPPVLSINFNPSVYGEFNVSCFEDNGMLGSDGSLQAVASGGVVPYQYSWNTGSSVDVINGLSPIEYTISVTDAVGCETIASYTLSAPDLVEYDVDFVNQSCDGFESGMILISNISGGVGPYLFSLDNQTFVTESSFEDLGEGSFTVFVQDMNNCISEISGQLVAPDIPEISFNSDIVLPLGDSIVITPILNQTTLTEINWSPITYLSCVDCLEPWTSTVNNNEYTLTVVSQDGCADSATIRVISDKRRRVYTPNIFSPDGNGINDVFFLSGGVEIENISSLRIFDRWGNIVFDQTNGGLPNDEIYGWNGKWNGKLVASGAYTWVAEVAFIDGVKLPYSGSITVIR